MAKLQSEKEKKKIYFLIRFASVSPFLLGIELETMEIPMGQFVGPNLGKHRGAGRLRHTSLKRMLQCRNVDTVTSKMSCVRKV